MTIYVNEEFNKHMVNKIISAYETKKKKDTLHIYLTSIGGELASCQVLEHFLNERAEDIVITATGYIYSAGFHLFLNFMGNKGIMQGCQGLIHLPRVAGVDVTSNGIIGDYQDDVAMWVKDKKNTTNWLSCYKPFLTEEEFKNLKAGKDLWIPHDRLVKIMKDQDKILNKQ